MTERFNFFDIYGYLLPGALLLVLVWLPWGLLYGVWPTADWGSALASVAVAYVMGHILYTLSEGAFSSKFRYCSGKPRYPSDLLLDAKAEEVLPEVYRLTPQTKAQLGLQIMREFGLDITKEEKRQLAFFLCRSFLVLNKSAAYSEQQNGMYVFTRGITGAFVFAAALYFGMGISGGHCLDAFCCYVVFLGALVIAGLLSALMTRAGGALLRYLRRGLFWVLTAAALIGGALVQKSVVRSLPSLTASTNHNANLVFALPSNTNLLFVLQARTNEMTADEVQKNGQAITRMICASQVQAHAPMLMLATGLAALVLAKVLHGVFRGFAVSFASTVYRDFNALASRPRQDTPR